MCEMRKPDFNHYQVFFFFFWGKESCNHYPVICCLALIEFTFSSLHPALSLSMKASAFVFTSGLGQNNAGIPKSPPSIPLPPIAAVDVGVDVGVEFAESSGSGDPVRELAALMILT
ncbi:hypothetical protein Scep_007878 [Stephania cephalantha]|uniref:Uncharacterized protein n=1 Tax=Stephania cephalantha TaxID=152367 RepID=A0AAP0KAN9_9MAGN